MGTRLPSSVRTIRPAGVIDSVEGSLPQWSRRPESATGSPSPAARASQSPPDLAKGRSRCPRCRGVPPRRSDRVANNSLRTNMDAQRCQRGSQALACLRAPRRRWCRCHHHCQPIARHGLRLQQDAGKLLHVLPGRRSAISSENFIWSDPRRPKRTPRRLPSAAPPPAHPPSGKTQRRRDRRRHVDPLRGCCWRDYHGARSTGDAAVRARPSARMSRTTSARARRRAPAPSLPPLVEPI